MVNNIDELFENLLKIDTKLGKLRATITVVATEAKDLKTRIIEAIKKGKKISEDSNYEVEVRKMRGRIKYKDALWDLADNKGIPEDEVKKYIEKSRSESNDILHYKEIDDYGE